MGSMRCGGSIDRRRKRKRTNPFSHESTTTWLWLCLAALISPNQQQILWKTDRMQARINKNSPQPDWTDRAPAHRIKEKTWKIQKKYTVRIVKLGRIKNQGKTRTRRVVGSDGPEALIRSCIAGGENRATDRGTHRIGSEGIEAEAEAAGDRRSGEVYGEMGEAGEGGDACLVAP